MFTKSETESKLDAEIQVLLDKLRETTDKDSDEYNTIIERIAKLHKLKTEERPKRFSPDTALVVAANLIGIIWVTQHERLHPITTKSLGLVMKPR